MSQHKPDGVTRERFSVEKMSQCVRKLTINTARTKNKTKVTLGKVDNRQGDNNSVASKCQLVDSYLVVGHSGTYLLTAETVYNLGSQVTTLTSTYLATLLHGRELPNSLIYTALVLSAEKNSFIISMIFYTIFTEIFTYILSSLNVPTNPSIAVGLQAFVGHGTLFLA